MEPREAEGGVSIVMLVISILLAACFAAYSITLLLWLRAIIAHSDAVFRYSRLRMDRIEERINEREAQES